MSLGHLAQTVAGGIYLRADFFGQEPRLRAFPRTRPPHHQKSFYLLHNLILPYRELCVNAAGEVQNYRDDYKERSASKRKRLYPGNRLHDYREHCDNAEEKRSDEGDAGNHPA